MATETARAEAEKLRVHILNIAMASKAGKEGDLREATEMLIDSAAESLDVFANRRVRTMLAGDF